MMLITVILLLFCLSSSSLNGLYFGTRFGHHPESLLTAPYRRSKVMNAVAFNDKNGDRWRRPSTLSIGMCDVNHWVTDESTPYHRRIINYNETNYVPYYTCAMFVSGVIGVEPKEVFFKNGDYLHMFPIAITGHFCPANELEKLKTSETMWLPSEMWNDAARLYNKFIHKGYHLHAYGNLISSKWIDKNSGEERKQFRFRITKVLEKDIFASAEKYLEQLPTIEDCKTQAMCITKTTSTIAN